MASHYRINRIGRNSEIENAAFEMSDKGSLVLARSIELFTIITAAYLGYSLVMGFGLRGRESLFGWLGALMLILSTFATVLFLSILVKPD